MTVAVGCWKEDERNHTQRNMELGLPQGSYTRSLPEGGGETGGMLSGANNQPAQPSEGSEIQAPMNNLECQT